ncbi:MAG TPA: tail-specific protease, partial [Chitinophagaceae bacterium]
MTKILQYMVSKKGWPVVALVLLCGLFFAFKSNGGNGDDSGTPEKQEKILRSVATLLKEKHYSPKNINDAFSKMLFRQYLSDLDPEKNILEQSDIDALRKYETTIDDEINGGRVEFFNAVNAIYEKRLPEIIALYKEILSSPFDFTKNEKVQLDQDKLQYASGDAERKETWRKRLKYLALERYADLLESRENNKGKDSFVVKTDAQLEAEARERVLKAMNRNFERIQARFTAEERFNMYINAMSEL